MIRSASRGGCPEILSDRPGQVLLWLVQAGSYVSYAAGTRPIEAGGTVASLYIVVGDELDEAVLDQVHVDGDCIRRLIGLLEGGGI